MTDCGPSPESCCISPLVTGGTFKRSYDGVTFTNPGYPATVSDFRLDKYEVTVGRFRKFVAAWVGGWRPAQGSGKHAHLNAGKGLVDSSTGSTFENGWDKASWDGLLAASSGAWDTNLACDPTFPNWTPNAGSNENRPITCQTWYEAYAFCIWDGGFLPSEAEWNYAAAGGAEQRPYPWGTPTPGANANLAVYGCYYGGTGSCTGVTNIATVGSVPAGNGKYGQSNLAGNVGEWNLDWNSSPYASVCNNCAFLSPTSTRMVRGGDFRESASILPASARGDGGVPTTRYNMIGLRCARAPGT